MLVARTGEALLAARDLMFIRGLGGRFLLFLDSNQWHHQNNPNGSYLIANLDCYTCFGFENFDSLGKYN
jgi:hypothetical protein